MGDVSEESVLRYLYTAGGKVSNSDVLKTFQHFVNHGDKNLRAKYREEFKVIIDRIAVTKSENGEKYVVLKKKYKQLMQEREAKRTDKQSNSPGHTASTPMQDPQNQDPALVVEFVPKSQYEVVWCGSPSIIITEAPESEAEDRQTLRCPTPQAEESQPLVHGDDEVDKDLGSKSESEQELEDDSSGSVGSLTVTLEPLEKEWIHSAACGQLENLTQLLQQDASLASKKDFTSTALHWAAKHGRGDMAALMADSGVDVNTKAGYTPLHIAALHGHHHIIDLLVRTYGAKENVRDHSGHLAYQYLNTKDPVGEDNEAGLQGAQVGERKARRLVTLFQHKKKWGSAEDLVTTVEERPLASQLTLPPFRPRKFSR